MRGASNADQRARGRPSLASGKDPDNRVSQDQFHTAACTASHRNEACEVRSNLPAINKGLNQKELRPHSTRFTPGGFQVPSPGGRIEGGERLGTGQSSMPYDRGERLGTGQSSRGERLGTGQSSMPYDRKGLIADRLGAAGMRLRKVVEWGVRG